MREIILTKEQVALVDDEDYEWINKYSWQAYKGKRSNTWYARRVLPHRRVEKCVIVLMHREIMKTPEGLEVDHKDRNGLNNQRLNLINCTHKENLKNRPINNVSKGIYWRKQKNKYVSIIYVDSRQIYLGYFKLFIDAVKAYNAAAIKYYGASAQLNML